jgi:lipoprotein LprG
MLVNWIEGLPLYRDMGGSDFDSDFVELDGTLYASVKPGNWTNLGAASTSYDVSAILNPDTGLANILFTFINPKTEGRETINGVQTVKITGLVSADAVNKIDGGPPNPGPSRAPCG